MLAEIDPNGKYFNLKQPLNYTMALKGGHSSTRSSTREMVINSYTNVLHETIHALGLMATGDNRWLTEGLCEYFGKAQGFDEWLDLGEWMTLKAAASGQLDSAAAKGNVGAVRYKREAERYLALGGNWEVLEDFSMALWLEAKAWCDLQYGADTESIGAVYADINGRAYTGHGADLTYAQAASLTMYLIERHGIDVVLAVWADYDSFAATFGGSYGEIVAAWQTWLAAK